MYVRLSQMTGLLVVVMLLRAVGLSADGPRPSTQAPDNTAAADLSVSGGVCSPGVSAVGCIAAGGCGTKGPTKCSSGSVILTAEQQKKLAGIDKWVEVETQRLRVKCVAARDKCAKMKTDPNATDTDIIKATHEYAVAESDLQLVPLLAKRAKDRVYTKEQKAQIASSGSPCGCGSPSGGCGYSTQSIPQKAK